jgi:hypothetical protein
MTKISAPWTAADERQGEAYADAVEREDEAMRIEPCGNCSGCEIDKRLRAALDELAEFYTSKARSLVAKRAEYGLRDRDKDRREEIMMRREWDWRSTEIIRAFRAHGCLQPRVTVPSPCYAFGPARSA